MDLTSDLYIRSDPSSNNSIFALIQNINESTGSFFGRKIDWILGVWNDSCLLIEQIFNDAVPYFCSESQAQTISSTQDVNRVSVKQTSISHVNLENLHIKQKLPKYVFSKVGSLGMEHLDNFLDEVEPEIRQKIILWSYSQRKFLSRGAGCNTKVIPLNSIFLNPKEEISMFKPVPLIIDEQGYALSLSRHDTDSAIFLTEEEIIRVHECKSFTLKLERQLGRSLYVGYYEDGKCIIQQPAVRACVPTSLAMILEDQKINFDFKILFTTNLANEDDIVHWLKPHGYEMIPLISDLTFSNWINDIIHWEPDVKTISNWIAENGPLLATIKAQELGIHTIVVDSINDEQVTIRDPCHGWRVTINTKLLLNTMAPKFLGIRKKQSQ